MNSKSLGFLAKQQKGRFFFRLRKQKQIIKKDLIGKGFRVYSPHEGSYSKLPMVLLVYLLYKKKVSKTPLEIQQHFYKKKKTITSSFFLVHCITFFCMRCSQCASLYMKICNYLLMNIIIKYFGMRFII